MDRAPTANDDITTGCMVGMDWVYKTPAMPKCRCFKAESVDQGEAEWSELIMAEPDGKINTARLPPMAPAIGGFPIQVADVQEFDTLHFVGAAWTNTALSNVSDGGNF